MSDYFENLSYELREENSNLKEQLGALKSIIRQTYKAIGYSDDIVEGEDWGGLPSRVACLKAAVDIGIHHKTELERKNDWIEQWLDTYIGDDPVVLELRKQYHEEFHSIKHDRPHKEIGRARAAKVHRVPTADEMVTAQQMTAPTRLEIEWRNIQKANEDTTKWYNCPRCDAGYLNQECVCKENEE